MRITVDGYYGEISTKIKCELGNGMSIQEAMEMFYETSDYIHRNPCSSRLYDQGRRLEVKQAKIFTAPIAVEGKN